MWSYFKAPSSQTTFKMSMVNDETMWGTLCYILLCRGMENENEPVTLPVDRNICLVKCINIQFLLIKNNCGIIFKCFMQVPIGMILCTTDLTVQKIYYDGSSWTTLLEGCTLSTLAQSSSYVGPP